jgi:hypothetical protein
VLDPPDPAVAHYRLAKLLHEKHDPAAKRHVLKALEEAPRFRDAQKLLLQINRENNQTRVPSEKPARLLGFQSGTGAPKSKTRARLQCAFAGAKRPGVRRSCAAFEYQPYHAVSCTSSEFRVYAVLDDISLRPTSSA